LIIHIKRQKILTPDEIENSTYIYTAYRTRAWSATSASASQSALISEYLMPIGLAAWPRPHRNQSINMCL
jgi:hypothetical protein